MSVRYTPDFEFVAYVMRQIRPVAGCTCNLPNHQSECPMYTWNNIVGNLAYEFHHANRNFDQLKFFKACGYVEP